MSVTYEGGIAGQATVCSLEMGATSPDFFSDYKTHVRRSAVQCFLILAFSFIARCCRQAFESVRGDLYFRAAQSVRSARYIKLRSWLQPASACFAPDARRVFFSDSRFPDDRKQRPQIDRS